MRQENRPGDEAMESLYPFLYSDTSDLPAVLGQVRASTLAKVEEILELRRVVGARDGARIADCARQAAARFAARGRRVRLRNRRRGTHRRPRPPPGPPAPPPSPAPGGRRPPAPACGAGQRPLCAPRPVQWGGRRRRLRPPA